MLNKIKQKVLENDDGKKFYHNGDEAQYTGKSQNLHGKVAYEAIWLEGHKKGKLFVTYRNPKDGKLDI